MTIADMIAGGLTGEWKMMLARPAARAALSSDIGQGIMMQTPGILEALRSGQGSPLTGALETSLTRKLQEEKPAKKEPRETALYGVRG